MPSLSACAVSMEYGGRRVLDRVDLSLSQGRLVVVSGRSGSGKSTLFSLLAGFERPSSGQVRFGERDLASISQRDRDEFRLRQVGVVFQDFRLLPDLTVVENIRLPLDLARRRGVAKKGRVSRKAQRERALELVERFGLQEVRDAFPQTLSGGEQQRVAVARALANDPGVLLADEPTANLDEENAHIVMKLFREVASSGRIVLVAAHDPLVVSYADTAYRLTAGRLSSMKNGTGRPPPVEGELRVPASMVRSRPGPIEAPGGEEAS